MPSGIWQVRWGRASSIISRSIHLYPRGAKRGEMATVFDIGEKALASDGGCHTLWVNCAEGAVHAVWCGVHSAQCRGIRIWQPTLDLSMSHSRIIMQFGYMLLLDKPLVAHHGPIFALQAPSLRLVLAGRTVIAGDGSKPNGKGLCRSHCTGRNNPANHRRAPTPCCHIGMPRCHLSSIQPHPMDKDRGKKSH